MRAFLLIMLLAAPLPAADFAKKLAAEVRDAIVDVTFLDRDGEVAGQGSGFVIDADGLIATNLHVIGEARPIRVRFADDSEAAVVEVTASDKMLDLAIIRVERKGLQALPLGSTEALADGEPIVALGNPHGLSHSVVAGVLSGTRDIDGVDMLQLAIPIEPGNSGGPVLNRQGEVLGIMTIKSLLSPNLGFAVRVDALAGLLAAPNPIAMDRWLTIGTLDAGDWAVRFNANWRQRAGRILVDSWGESFGGRSLCLWQTEPPEPPYEVAVSVKLDDEAGAAGLVFLSDGEDKHYGFYPSGGRMRLTRFAGPTVFSWTILEQLESVAYRPGEWNSLKVRVEPKLLRCFVNGEELVVSDDRAFNAGKVGLAKFRDTKASFRNFRIGEALQPDGPPRATREAVKALLAESRNALDVDALLRELAQVPAAAEAIQSQADALAERVQALRDLAALVHASQVSNELAALFADEEIDLVHAALLIARLDNSEVDVDSYRDMVDRMLADLAKDLEKDAADSAKLAALSAWFFQRNGFHGSRTNYYNRSNSYMNEVLDDREGLPITLSVLFMELGRRLGLHIEGVGLPGHFVVRAIPADGEPQLIDVFAGGDVLSEEDAAVLVGEITGWALREADLASAEPRAITVRMLRNLLGLAHEERDFPAALRYVEAILAVEPDQAEARWMRIGLLAEAGRVGTALNAIEAVIADPPEGVDVHRVIELRDYLQGQLQ
jgi:serine protease Do